MILVVNAGSSSIKVELFAADLTSCLRADVSGIGGAPRLRVNGVAREVEASDHAAALDRLLAALADEGVTPGTLIAAAHRVVHGGAALTRPVLLDDDTIARIEACIPLAPLHNPSSLAAIRTLRQRAPELPQAASFDTAFHATNPAVATAYALPGDIRAHDIRRYGFHGLSYAWLVTRIDPLPSRLLACHLGNGASLCAIRDGRSVATTMGFSPVSGLTMGTRSGDVDPAVVLRLAAARGIEATERLLNHDSGLTALGGTNDMAALLARDDDTACFAVEHFCYWAVRHAGSMIAAMGGLDAVAFTGGIGENAAEVRERIVEDLSWAGRVPVHVVEADEERQIARDVLELLRTEDA